MSVNFCDFFAKWCEVYEKAQVLQVFCKHRLNFVKIIGFFGKVVISRVGRGEKERQTHAPMVWEVASGG